MRRILPFACLLGAAACSSTDNGSLQLVTGGETDTFTQSPQPTKLVVYAVDTSGNQSQIASTSLPTGTVDLGNQDESAVASVEVQGTDASGKELLFGASLPLQYGALAGGSLPVFVQRTNEFARLPSPPPDARQSPTLDTIVGQFLLVGGGSDPSLAATTQIYDFATLTPLTAPPALPRAPLSIAMVSTVGLLIDQSGGTYFDFSQNASVDVAPPSGFGFGDVAGGQTVYDATDGWVFVVGATRTQGSATSAVLLIDTTNVANTSYVTGNLSWLTLTAPRLGATATWVPGRGLVVTGGSGSAAGVEVVAPKATNGSALPFPPDPSMGAGAAMLDAQDVLVAGGITPTGQDAGVRKISLACTSSCATQGVTAWAGLPVPLTNASTFTLANGGSEAFVVGSELTSGLTHAFLLTSAAAKEVPTKVPHTNARATLSPVAQYLGIPPVILLFGGAGEIESFAPTL